MKTPTLTAAEFRKMCATDYGWGASIEPDGSVSLTIPSEPALFLYAVLLCMASYFMFRR
jgi:hypothetical protein